MPYLKEEKEKDPPFGVRIVGHGDAHHTTITSGDTDISHCVRDVHISIKAGERITATMEVYVDTLEFDGVHLTTIEDIEPKRRLRLPEGLGKITGV